MPLSVGLHWADYLSELCTPAAQVAERQHLRSASRHLGLLVVSRFQLDTYGRRTFAVAGPTMELVRKQFAWAGHANWLFSSYTEDVCFWSVLGTLSALEAFFLRRTMRYINCWHLHYIGMWRFSSNGEVAEHVNLESALIVSGNVKISP